MLELLAKIRQEKKRQNEKLRKQGLIPAVLYGPKTKNLLLSVDSTAFNRIYQEAGESTLIKLKIEGGKERVVLIYEIAKDPLNERPIHIDFYQVKMDEPIKVEIPLRFTGESEAVKSLGGVLVKSIQEVEIEALPQDLIHEIEVDITPLKNFEKNIYIKDLKVPEKVKIEAEPDEVVASVIPPRTEEELEALAEKPIEQVEEVEVEAKGKAKEEAEEPVPGKEEPVQAKKEDEKEE